MIIGYLTSDLFTSYSCTMWTGLREICRENHASLLYFSGGAVQSPDLNQSARNPIYDLVSAKKVDGILINSATIFHHLQGAGITEFYEKYAHIPIVSIGVKVGHWPAVLTDNPGGVRKAMLHLLEHHNYRKIAFVGGPVNNLEATIRLNAYRQVLDDFGIAYDAKKVVFGTYSTASGAECLDELLARDLDFDAVLTANDDMAIGVMNRAQSLGIVVPNDLAVCGFDDIPEAPMLSVPLSTARQPFLKQAQTACQLLIDCIQSGKVHEDIVLNTEFIQRRSCGCLSDAVKQAGYVPTTVIEECKPSEISVCIERLKSEREKIIKKVSDVQTDGPFFLKSAGTTIFDSLITALETEGDLAALADVDRLFNRAFIEDFTDFSYWQNTVSMLIEFTKRYLKTNDNCAEIAQAFWQQVRILLQETSFYSQSFTKMQADYHITMLRQVSGKLVRSFELDKLLKTIKQELPKIDIQACYLCLYDQTSENRETSRLILAYDESGEIPLPEDGLVFNTRELLPRSVLSFDAPDAHIVEALFFEGEQFGYIFFKTNPQKVVFEELRQQISSAIKGALLTEAVRSLAIEQETHAKALQAALDSLKENQRKMLLSEKMASLGRLTAGIAHEMNTPLATVRMAVMELQSLINEYYQSVDDTEVTPEDHRAIATDMLSSTELIRKSAERAHGFVQGVKSQTRDLKSAERHVFDVVPVIREAILLLNHTIRKSDCPVNFTPKGRRLTVFGTEGRLSQVVTNLVVNAIDASKNRRDRAVEIEATESPENIVITVSDRGEGIDNDTLSKIFDPMFTTKSLAEGTGLGLTIVHDIVHGDFGGTIEVSSKLGEGTVFTIEIPRQYLGGNDAKKISD